MANNGFYAVGAISQKIDGENIPLVHTNVEFPALSFETGPSTKIAIFTTFFPEKTKILVSRFYGL